MTALGLRLALPILGKRGSASVGTAPDAIAGLTAWLDFTDASNMYTDAGATTPITNGGDPLRIRNKANGTIWNKTSTANPVFIAAGDGGTSQVDLQTAFWSAAANAAPSNYFSATTATFVLLARLKETIGSVNVTNLQILFSMDNGRFDGRQIIDATGANVRWGFRNRDSVAIADVDTLNNIPVGNWCVIVCQHSGGVARCRVNRGAWASMASGNTVLGTLLRLGNNTAIGRQTLKHITVYNTALSDADLTALENWMASKAGITLP